MRKETFLKLCGERDRGIIAGDCAAGEDDLLRLEYLAGLMGCLEIELSMYLACYKREPIAKSEDNTEIQTRWQQQFLCSAPDGETTEKIYRLLKQNGVADSTPS